MYEEAVSVRSNRSVFKKYSSNFYLLLLLLVSQTVILFVLRLFLRSFQEAGILRSNAVQHVLFGAIGVIFAGLDLYVLYRKVILVARAFRRPPVRCRVEDILLVGYTDDGRRKYSPYPILRAMDSGRLFLAFEDDVLLGYRTRSDYRNNDLRNFRIYRKDWTPVELGDPADLYPLKILDVPISVDEAQGTLMIKNKRIPLYHRNKEIDIAAFRKITFFCGVVDVDVETSF